MPIQLNWYDIKRKDTDAGDEDPKVQSHRKTRVATISICILQQPLHPSPEEGEQVCVQIKTECIIKVDAISQSGRVVKLIHSPLL